MAGFDSVLDSLKKAEREVEAQLAGIRGAISSLAGSGRKRASASIATAAPRKRRKLSAAARKAISNAQKKRWAKQKAAANK